MNASNPFSMVDQNSHPSDVESSRHNRTPTVSLTTMPFPASKKVYVKGTQPNVNVPMREITLTPTKQAHGGASTPNAPVLVYDTSGPFTDPDIKVDIRKGVNPLKARMDHGT